MSFWETEQAINKLADYHKMTNGSWRADLAGAIKVHAEGETLDECRYRLHKAVDARLLEWVMAAAKRATPRASTRRKK